MKKKVLVIGVFITLVSILITVNVIFHETLSRELAASYNKQQAFIAQGIANSIKTDIDKQIIKIKLIADLLSHYSAKEIESINEVFLTLFERELEKGFAVTVFDRWGNIVATTSALQESVLPDRWGELFDHRQGSVFSDLDNIYALSPIVRNDAKPTGWVLINLPIQDIARKHMTPFTDQDQGYAWLVDHSGNLLCHPLAQERHGNDVNDVYDPQPTCFDCHNAFDLSRRLLEGDMVDSRHHFGPGNRDIILSFSHLTVGDNTWVVVVGSPYAEVVDAARNSMQTYSWLVVAIFAIFFFGTSILAYLIRKNILTERAANEAILVESKKLDTIVAAIGAGLIFLDQQYTIVWANETVEEWGGTLVGKPWGDICPVCPQRQEKSGRVYHDICKGLFDRKRRTFQVTSAPINNSQGEVIGILKLIQDITEIKTIEDKIAQTEKLSALGRVAAGIAHEIGNPLTSISSFVQILKEQAGDKGTRENLDRIEHNIQRIIKILNQMSRFSKVPTMEIREHNINDLIESCLEIVKFDKKLKTVKLQVELADQLPPVRVDDGNLIQVFINLILNAADAIGESGGTITIRTFEGQNQVVAQICDNGPGIPEDLQNQIFDPFFTTKEKGTGLGLSISYEIVKKFGGDLFVESQAGQGGVFFIILPAGNQGEKHG